MTTLKFNATDKKIIEYAVAKRRNIFIHGPAGVGKSTLIKEIVKQATNRRVVVTATTGVAAINIGGITLHRFAGIQTGRGTAEELWEKISKKQHIIRKWRTTDTLFIDEVSMLGGELFDKINFIAQKARKSSLPFGGVQVILTGDLLQLPPIRDTWIFQSEVWDLLKLEQFNLTEAKRYTDAAYYNTLLRIRNGEPLPEDIHSLRERFEEYQRVKKTFDEADIQPTILYSKRYDVEEFNLAKLDEIEEEEWEFGADDKFTPKKAKLSQQQKSFYATFLDDSLPRLVILKIGAQVMLKYNLDVEAGLVNGSRGVVLKITEGFVTVKFLGNKILPITAVAIDYEDDFAIATRIQIPLILAWSCTIHKSQGSTLDYAVADVGSDVFAYGQAYVALSRIRDIKGLFLSEFDPTVIRADPIVLKFVESMNIKEQEEAKT